VLQVFFQSIKEKGNKKMKTQQNKEPPVSAGTPQFATLADINSAIDATEKQFKFHTIPLRKGLLAIVNNCQASALFLQQLIFLSDVFSQEWIYWSMQKFYGMAFSRRDIEKARETLLALGFIEERLGGTPERPSVLHYKVNADAVFSALNGILETPVVPGAGIDAGEITPVIPGAGEESKTAKQPPQPAEKPEIAISGNFNCQKKQHIREKITDKKETTTAANPDGIVVVVLEEKTKQKTKPSSQPPVKIPECLKPEGRAATRAVNSSGLSDLEKQAAMNQVAEKYREGKIKTTPLRYLRGVLNQWDSAAFNEEREASIDAEKRRKQAEERLKQTDRASVMEACRLAKELDEKNKRRHIEKQNTGKDKKAMSAKVGDLRKLLGGAFNRRLTTEK